MLCSVIPPLRTMVFSGGQFFAGSVAGDDCAPAGCGDVVAGFDAGRFEFAGAGSHSAGEPTFFLERTFFAPDLGSRAGACALGDWAEEGFVASGCVGCCAVCSCATGASANESDGEAERAISPG